MADGELAGFLPAGEMLKAGVYALMYKGRVVYIGKAKCMLVRVYSHRSLAGRKVIPRNLPTSAKGVKFDDCHIRPCSLDVIDELEREMIELYRPQYNTQLKPKLIPPSRAAITIGGREFVFTPKSVSAPPAPISRRF